MMGMPWEIDVPWEEVADFDAGTPPKSDHLRTPTLIALPRVADQMSFLYLDRARVHRDAFGVRATAKVDGRLERVYLPNAAIACLLLGPGTSVTQPALAELAANGTTVICVNDGASRVVSGFSTSDQSARWVQRQAEIVTDPNARVAAARRLYERRFGTFPESLTIAQMRGMEGHRVRETYRALAKQHGVKFRRNYERASWDDQDPVNRALSVANTCLYGVTHCCVLAIGASPALGIIHTGKQHSFVYDIADLYKLEVAAPLAFAAAKQDDPERWVRRQLRSSFTTLRLMRTIVADIFWVLEPDSHKPGSAIPAMGTVDLWDPAGDGERVAGGVNYSSNRWVVTSFDE